MSNKPTTSLGGEALTQPTQPTQQQGQQQGQQQQTFTAPPSGADRSALNMLMDTGPEVLTGSTSQKAAHDVMEGMSAIAKTATNPPSLALLEHQTLNIPAILVFRLGADSTLHYYTLMLECCAEPLENAVKTIEGNRSIEIDMPTSRYFDNELRSRAEHVLRAELVKANIGSAKFRSCGHCVIINGTDVENLDSLKPFFDSSTAAIGASLRAKGGLATTALTAAVLSSSELQLVARNKVMPSQTSLTPQGRLVASDFSTTLIVRDSSQAAQEKRSLHGRNADVHLARAEGYVDFASAPPSAMEVQQAQAHNVPTLPGYHPYVVLTRISPVGGKGAHSDNLLTQLLGLASVAGIMTAGRWNEIYQRSAMDNGAKSSIGAFAYEHNADYMNADFKPMSIPVSTGMADEKGTMSVPKIINTYCHNTMTVAIDVEQGGSESWVQSVLLGATPGSSKEATIIRELDSFSDGVFSTIWGTGKSIMAFQPTTIHLGNYTNQVTGNRSDIRQIDMLAMLEATKGDPERMRRWQDGFSPGYNEVVVDAKRRAIKEYAPDVEFTGLATRCWISADFMAALDLMLKECGLGIGLEGLNNMIDTSSSVSMFGSGYAGNVTSNTMQMFGMNGGYEFASNSHMGTAGVGFY